MTKFSAETGNKLTNATIQTYASAFFYAFERWECLSKIPNSKKWDGSGITKFATKLNSEVPMSFVKRNLPDTKVRAPENYAYRTYRYIKQKKNLYHLGLFDLMTIGKKNLGDFSNLPIAKRRKIEFEDIPKTKMTSFNHYIKDTNDFEEYSGKLLTACLKNYYQAHGSDYSGLKFKRLSGVLQLPIDSSDDEDILENWLADKIYL